MKKMCVIGNNIKKDHRKNKSELKKCCKMRFMEQNQPEASNRALTPKAKSHLVFIWDREIVRGFPAFVLKVSQRRMRYLKVKNSLGPGNSKP